MWHIRHQKQLPAAKLPVKSGNPIFGIAVNNYLNPLLKWYHSSLASLLGCAMALQYVKPLKHPDFYFLVILNKKIVRTIENCSQKGLLSTYAPEKSVCPSTAASHFIRLIVIQTSYSCFWKWPTANQPVLLFLFIPSLYGVQMNQSEEEPLSRCPKDRGQDLASAILWNSMLT